MTRREKAIRFVGTPDSAPRYELRVRRHGPTDAEYEIWQMPAAATPHVTSPLRVAGLRGRNLELVEHRVLKRLAQAGVKLGRSADPGRPGYPLSEDLALTLGLLFRTLSPMRSRDNMRAVAEGIEAMEREETALLARHGHAPPAPSPRPHRFAYTPHRAESKEVPLVRPNLAIPKGAWSRAHLGRTDIRVKRAVARHPTGYGHRSSLLEHDYALP